LVSGKWGVAERVSHPACSRAGIEVREEKGVKVHETNLSHRGVRIGNNSRWEWGDAVAGYRRSISAERSTSGRRSQSRPESGPRQHSATRRKRVATCFMLELHSLFFGGSYTSSSKRVSANRYSGRQTRPFTVRIIIAITIVASSNSVNCLCQLRG
jgi:hypothetical protein